MSHKKTLYNAGVEGKVKNIGRAMKASQNSRKPEYVQDMIELMYPNTKKLELFARRSRKGWDVWGNETTKFDKEDYNEAD